ncbi:MAG: hypothetical protein ACP6IY_09525 [Promethearchaeia archaeon]
MTKLKIEAVAVLNEEKQEFFIELMKKGVDAIKPEMDKQLKKMTNLEKANELKERHIYFQLPDNKGFIENKRKAKDLKEEIENEGCGRYMLPIGSYKSCGRRTPLSLNDDGINYCDDCQEAIKICEEILK